MRRSLPIAAALAFLCVLPGRAEAAPPPMGNYIVVLNDTVADPGAVAAQHGRAFGGSVSQVYRHALKGYAVTLPSDKLARLQANPLVRFVSEDREFQATEQFLPRGVDRIDGERSSAKSGNGRGSVDIDVAVLDTGIDPTHPDLNVAGGTNCTNDKASGFVDTNGHGTAVAGIIGAKDDDFGFVGVVPGARLWAVRVLNKQGSGTESMILCGIDWVTATVTDADPSNDIEIANMSLGGHGSDDGNCGLSKKDLMHQAICRSVAAGVTYVVAAMNDSDDFADHIPAAYDEVLTVTAMTDFDGQPGGVAQQPSWCPGFADDTAADVFSNFATLPTDQAHTLSAPGTCVPTTGLTSATGFASATGTSLASPHVAGVAALCIASGPCAGLGPAQIIQKIVADAAAYNNAHPEYGFAGDPLRPVEGKYFGYLIRAALY